jgi:hypothetical protein
MTLHNATRPIALAWRPWAQPDIGSLKQFAEDSGATDGDWLVLVFDRAGTADVYAVVDERRSRDLGMLLRLVGIRVDQPFDHLTALVAIGEVLGLDTSDSDSLRFRIHAALKSRRDVDIVDLADEVLLG